MTFLGTCFDFFRHLLVLLFITKTRRLNYVAGMIISDRIPLGGACDVSPRRKGGGPSTGIKWWQCRDLNPGHCGFSFVDQLMS